jgi:hypothetical protein
MFLEQIRNGRGGFGKTPPSAQVILQSPRHCETKGRAMNDRIDTILQAFLDHQAMEETKSYLERGRRFEDLTVDDLSKGWAAAFTAVCADGDEGGQTDLDDLGAELGLRNLERPEHLVHPRAMTAALERVRNSQHEAFGPVTEAIGRFMERMDEPKN